MCLFNKSRVVSEIALEDEAKELELTPHLLLLLDVRILDGQDCHSVLLIVLHFHELGNLEVQRSYAI